MNRLPTQDAIVEAVRNGSAAFAWTFLRIGNVTLRVFADALKVEGVRVPVTARTSQQVADLLDAMLTTPAIEDACVMRALHRPPMQLLPIDCMQEAIIARSRRIDEAIGAVDPGNLVAPVGKSWVLSTKLSPSRACNYGLHAKGAPYMAVTPDAGKLWQQPGHAHNLDHTDWSQLLRLVHRTCWVDDEERDLARLLSDLSYARLLHGTGLGVPMTRQPGVQAEPARPQDGVIVMPPLVITAAPPAPAPTMPQDAPARGGPAQTATATPGAPTGLPGAGVGDTPGVPFRQARHYRAGRPGPVRLVCIHVAECGESLRAAESLQSYAAGMADGRKASWHYAVDADSATQSVMERDVAFAAPGANADGIQIELAGRSAQGAAGWSDDYSQATLRRAASIVAGALRRHDLPIDLVREDRLPTGARGITGHCFVSKAYRKSTHTDPGPTFPWDAFLAMVREASGGSG